jgi:hypothetical protein
LQVLQGFGEPFGDDGGYALTFPGNVTLRTYEEVMRKVLSASWLDRKTRKVLIALTLYDVHDHVMLLVRTRAWRMAARRSAHGCACAALLPVPPRLRRHVAPLPNGHGHAHGASSCGAHHEQIEVEFVFGISGTTTSKTTCAAQPVNLNDEFDMNWIAEGLLACLYVSHAVYLLHMLCRKRKQKPGEPLVRPPSQKSLPCCVLTLPRHRTRGGGWVRSC